MVDVDVPEKLLRFRKDLQKMSKQIKKSDVGLEVLKDAKREFFGCGKEMADKVHVISISIVCKENDFGGIKEPQTQTREEKWFIASRLDRGSVLDFAVASTKHLENSKLIPFEQIAVRAEVAGQCGLSIQSFNPGL